jgi:hypothetical protein
VAKRKRPRVEQAVAVPEEGSALERSRQILWDGLPDIMTSAVALAKAGNVQVTVAVLGIIKTFMSDSGPTRGSELLEKIKEIRKQSGYPNGSGQAPDLGTAGGDGPDDTNAPGEEDSLGGGVDPSGSDI